MASDGQYRVVHAWAEQERLWTNTAMVRELLQALEQDRLCNGGIVKEQQILDGAAMDHAFDNDGFLDHIIEDMKRRAWLHALTLGWLPLELPQIERHAESTFGRESLRIIVSMRCDMKTPG